MANVILIFFTKAQASESHIAPMSKPNFVVGRQKSMTHENSTNFQKE